MFSLLRTWRRKRILDRHRIPTAIWAETLRQIPVLRRLSDAERRRLHDLTLLFLKEKTLEPAGGMTLDEQAQVRIAALACLPILNLDLDYYEGFVSVIIYPEEFVVRERMETDEAGVVHTSDEVLAGEAWEHGPVVLSWSDVIASGHGKGFNVVAHEFAHKLDALDGVVNGIPPLHAGMKVSAWTDAFQGAFDDLAKRLEDGEDTWLDPYAAESPGEFFAMCVEMFFDLPAGLEAHYPAVYRQLSDWFRQHPAAR